MLRKLLALPLLLALCAQAHAQQATAALASQTFCQLTASGSAALVSTCTQATFTGTAAGNVLTASSVTGYIHPGATISGTGVPANTTITAQLTSTAANSVNGGAGTYQTSQATTASSASITSSGIPLGSNMAVIQVDTANIRWRDDGGAPTTSIGMQIASGGTPYYYSGPLSQLQVIAVTGSPVVNMTFYKAPQ